MKKAILIITLFLLPMLMFCQADKTNYIYISGGVYHLNPNYGTGNFDIENSGYRFPFFSNEFGLKIERDYQHFCWGYGFAIIQNRRKGAVDFFLWKDESILTKTFFSVPFYAGLKTKNFKYKIGIGIDYFLYLYLNYSYTNISGIEETGRDANRHNDFEPWCIGFLYGEIPFSLHLEAEIGYTFTLAEKHKFGVSSSFKMFEVVSLYGRNYSYTNTELQTKSYYYPISVSLSVAYYLPNK